MVFLALLGTRSPREEDSFGGAADGALALAFFAPRWRDVDGGSGADNSLALLFCPRLHDSGVDDGPLVLLGAPCLPDSGGGVDDGASALSSCPPLEQCQWRQRGG
jgi:hypothetical protein